MLQPETEAPPSTGLIDSMSQKWQYILDKLSPQIAVRWVMMLVAVSLYFLRVYFLNGWFIVTYGLGIYLLNQMIGFVSPQVSDGSGIHLQRPLTFLSSILKTLTPTWVSQHEKEKSLGLFSLSPSPAHRWLSQTLRSPITRI
jgi:hypothetical protein